jgi:membrane protein
VIQNFAKGEKPLTAPEISHQLDIPIRFINDILFELGKSNILSKAEIEGSEEHGYQPARDINLLTINYVIEAMEKRGLDNIPFIHAPEFAALSAAVESFSKAIEKLPENKLLKNL